jgi:hypothetical protein
MMTKPHQAQNQCEENYFDSIFTGLILFLCAYKLLHKPAQNKRQ